MPKHHFENHYLREELLAPKQAMMTQNNHGPVHQAFKKQLPKVRGLNQENFNAIAMHNRKRGTGAR